MSNRERLVVSIVHFLGEQLRKGGLTEDANESLEIAIQCLESAFGVSSSDTHLMVSRSLQDIFDDVAQKEPAASKDAEASYEDKREAERLKNEGNDLMKQERYEEALKNYTNAIQLDCKNPVYFCNRAAAYSKLNNHVFAIEDCQRAVQIDPSYSKAYGRMGLAYASLNDHIKAKHYYEKAINLDPHNESFRNNLRIAEEKAREFQNQNPFGGLLGNMNLESLMQNPAVMNFAQRMMSNESGATNLLSNMMNTFAETAQPNSNSSNDQSNNDTNNSQSESAGQNQGMPDLTPFLRVGQQFVEQIQQSNPDLIEQLRSQFNNLNPDTNSDKNPEGL